MVLLNLQLNFIKYAHRFVVSAAGLCSSLQHYEKQGKRQFHLLDVAIKFATRFMNYAYRFVVSVAELCPSLQHYEKLGRRKFHLHLLLLGLQLNFI